MYIYKNIITWYNYNVNKKSAKHGGDIVKKYVQVGCGSRGTSGYSIPMVTEYKDCAVLMGVYDTNRKRAELVSKLVGEEIPVFDSYDEMLEKVKPDTVIITPKDCEHDQYIIKALKAGCDVISEKPLTTTFEKALAIKKAQEETGKKLTVTFNLRFHPLFKRMKEIVASGVIGDIYSVNYEWMLDTRHGADYFRRWHRERKNSGSLLVHKSTHHFDIINWLLEQDPVEVNAYGSRRFYGPVTENRSERCLTCPHKTNCKYFLDITTPEFKELYLECEDADGYFRDRCIFSEEIDIEDTVSLSVRYSGGTLMNYSLTAHSPYEGFAMVLNGSLGRIEIKNARETYLKIYNRKGEEIVFNFPPPSNDAHGGADKHLRDTLFRGYSFEDIGQMADLRAGLMSIGIGMAANISMAENRRVLLEEFYDELK